MAAILTPEFRDEYSANIRDWKWRVSNLYHIKSMKAGDAIPFRPNPIQRRFMDDMWRRNVVLKPRGIGMSTLIDVIILDDCYVIPNFSAALCAHTEDKAQEIFRDLILFPHEHCEYPVKRGLKEGTYGSKSEMQFDNGSTVAVYVTMAGGSHQAIVSTELGVLSALNPEAAKNFKMQGLPTARDDNSFVFIESTGQGGPQGVFYDTCMAAREETNMILSGQIKGSKTSYRFHFYPWFDDPRKSRKSEYPITKEDAQYFEKIERECKVKLTNEQKWWYCETANGPTGLAKIGEMHSQYPSTFDEAFECFVQDAYLTEALNRATQDGRVGTFKYNPMYPVDTWWDLGLDGTSIWFSQTIGNMVNFIWYFEDSGKELPYYLDYLQGGMVKLPWNKSRYRFHTAPHDVVRRDFATLQNVWQVAKNRGVAFERGIERPARKQDSIQAAMMFCHRCNFDKENCAQGLRRLENYRPQWDAKLDMAKPNPRHDKNSHGGDAFQTAALYHDMILKKHGERAPVRATEFAMPQDYPR
ncbi:MAG: hypothetical protein WCS52_01980 [bacterium]